MIMGDNANNNSQGTADYLAQLLKDKKQLAAFPNVFMHLERLLDEEVNKVRNSLFQVNGMKKDPLMLPEPQGPILSHAEKVYVPVKEFPDFNFVGRILGPRGMTAKQLEQETGCKIMVRGKGSMRDKKKEELNRGKPNWEHLNDELHVLITVEDTANRAAVKLQRAVEEVQKLLVPAADGEDELKKRQLMELAIINGTYRDSSIKDVDWNQYLWNANPFSPKEMPRLMAPGHMGLTAPMRSPTAPLGAPLILSPRLPGQLINGSMPQHLLGPETTLLYAPTYADYQYAAAAALASPALLTAAEYPDHTAGGLFAR